MKVGIEGVILRKNGERDIHIITNVAAGISSKLGESKAGVMMGTGGIQRCYVIMHFAFCQVSGTHYQEEYHKTTKPTMATPATPSHSRILGCGAL